jgi:ATP-dependent Lon protease
MARLQTATLPVIPLARGTVLLPGVIQRIPVSSNRPDIPALLAAVYTRAAAKAPNERIDAVPIACVPITSPFLGPDGQLLIQNGEQVDESRWSDIEPSSAKKADLYKYGVAARITGIEGRGTAEFALRVEGTARIRVEKVTQERPNFEAVVKYCPDEGKPIERIN